jgi:hypothetical protein
MIFEKSSFGLDGGGFRELVFGKSVRDAGKKITCRECESRQAICF